MFQSSWWEIATHIISLASAYALALPVGWDRERDARSAGIRTFPLVAIASCGFVLVGSYHGQIGRETTAQHSRGRGWPSSYHGQIGRETTAPRR
mgnify:CR=1 FL=1